MKEKKIRIATVENKEIVPMTNEDGEIIEINVNSEEFTENYVFSKAYGLAIAKENAVMCVGREEEGYFHKNDMNISYCYDDDKYRDNDDCYWDEDTDENFSTKKEWLKHNMLGCYYLNEEIEGEKHIYKIEDVVEEVVRDDDDNIFSYIVEDICITDKGISWGTKRTIFDKYFERRRNYDSDIADRSEEEIYRQLHNYDVEKILNKVIAKKIYN